MSSTRYALVLALLGLVVFTSFGYALFIHKKEAAFHREPAIVEGKSAFEKGEYYFNHDEDPGGAYDIEKAKDYYIVATQENTSNPLAWYQLGRIYFIEGNFEEAIAAFEKLHTEFPAAVSNVDYMLGLTYGYKARYQDTPEDWIKAEEAFLRFIEKAPTSPYPRVDLAWVYFSQGKYTEMLAPLKEGLEFAPENPWLLNMYGLALLNSEEKEEARTYFYKARDNAATLTVEDWGRTYPGNDPLLWEKGLQEFKALIEKNIALVESQ